MGNGLGFFKTLYTYGDRSFFRIFRFIKPLPWHGEKVQPIFALSTGRESPEDLLLFKGWMDRLLSDRNQARAVLEADCRTVADVLKTLFYSS